MTKLGSVVFGCFIGIGLLIVSTVAFQPSKSRTARSISKHSKPNSVVGKTPLHNPTPISMTASSKDEKDIPQTETSSIWDTAITKIGSSASALVAGTFYVVLAYYRDSFIVSFFIGAISNGVVSKVLKKVLNQERPAELNTADIDLPPSDNGMPSSHAMSLGFICTFTALQLPWTAIPLLGYVVISLIYRVRTNLHTIEQIAVGISLGCANGYAWRSLCLGTNPWDVNVMDWVSASFLNEQGLLPIYGLAVPALVGAAVVGSVERRISNFLKNQSKED